MSLNLLAAMQTELNRSKKLHKTYFLINLLLIIVGTVACLKLDDTTNDVIAFLLFVAQVVSLFISHLAKSHQDLGDQFRRLTITHNSLGISPSAATIATLGEKVGKLDDISQKYPDGYYSSTAPEGPRRLIENVAESAFFTGSLAKKVAGFYFFLSAIGLFTAVAVLIVVSLFSGPAPTTAKIAMVMLMAFSGESFLRNALSYSALARSAGEIVSQCEMSRDEPAAAFQLYTEYNCALGGVPPIPTRLYDKHKDSLNELWTNRFHAVASNTR